MGMNRRREGEDGGEEDPEEKTGFSWQCLREKWDSVSHTLQRVWAPRACTPYSQFMLLLWSLGPLVCPRLAHQDSEITRQ